MKFAMENSDATLEKIDYPSVRTCSLPTSIVCKRHQRVQPSSHCFLAITTETYPGRQQTRTLRRRAKQLFVLIEDGS